MTDETQLKVQCHCGWHVEGGRGDVVSATQQHVLKSHWVEVDEDEILEMATPL